MFGKVVRIFLFFFVLNLSTVYAQDRAFEQRQVAQIVSLYKESFINFDPANPEAKKEEQRIDIRKALVAINKAKDLKYLDVADLLIDILNYELKTRKSVRVIIDGINVLEVLATDAHVFPKDALTTGQSPLLDLRDIVLGVMKKDPKKFGSDAAEIKKILRVTIDEAKRRKSLGMKKLFPETEHLTLITMEQKVVEIKNLDEVVKARDAQLVQEEINRPVSQDTPEQIKAKEYKNFKDELLKRSRVKNEDYSEVKAGDSGPVDLVLAGTYRFISDSVASKLIKDDFLDIMEREDVIKKTLLTFARYKQRNAALLGPRGAGKTSILEAIAKLIILGGVENNSVTSFLKDAVILETSAADMSRLAKSNEGPAQADAVRAYLKAVNEVQKITKRRVILFIDEMHMLDHVQANALKTAIESPDMDLLVVGATTSLEYRNAFGRDDAFNRRWHDISVPQLSEETIFRIFKASWAQGYQRRRNVTFSDDVIKLLIRRSTILMPANGALDGTFMIAEDISNLIRFDVPHNDPMDITSEVVYDFIKDVIGLPIDPTDFAAMKRYKEELLKVLKTEVQDQDRMITDLLNLWMSVLRNESPRGVKVAALMGPTGAGKTEVSIQLAKNAFVKMTGSKDRVLIIKGSEYAGDDSNKFGISRLLGAPAGVREASQSAGILMNWLDASEGGKYSGVIIIDEVEKASPQLWLALMEMFEKGYITGGDGKTRYLNKHLIVMTTNAGAEEIYPEGFESWTEEKLMSRLDDFTKEDLKEIFRKFTGLRIEIVNRIDLYTAANVIRESIAVKIASRWSDKKVAEYLDRSKINVVVDNSVIEHIVKSARTLKNGARPVIFDMEMYIPQAVDEALGSTKYQHGDTVKLSLARDSKNNVVIRTELNSNIVNSAVSRIKSQAKEELGKLRLSVPSEEEITSCSRLFGT